jgi:glutaredoxin 3
MIAQSDTVAGVEPRVVVLTTTPCGFCERAKSLLAARGVAYREEFIPRTPAGRQRLAEFDPHARTFPWIVIDGESIGGYRELVSLDRGGGLEALVR